MKDEKRKLYENLLEQYSDLKKECSKLQNRYILEFGDNIQLLFELKVEAITLKKKINFCVKKKNFNNPIYREEIENFFDEEVQEYIDNLEFLKAYREELSSSREISFDDLREVKKVYRKIAHLIHPDTHPNFLNDEELSEMWEETVDAYNRNDLKELKEIYERIILLVDDIDFEIENIDEKIELKKKEMDEIRQKEPYTYKYIFDSKEEIKIYREKIIEECKSYEEYIKNLKYEFSKFTILEDKNEA